METGRGEEKCAARKQVAKHTVYLGTLERLILCRGDSYPAVLVEGLQLSLETKLLG